MRKVYLQNLGLIITEKCNFNCAMCLRGKCSNKEMSDEVLEATFENVIGTSCLSVCGGEVTLALERLEKLFSYIITKKILLEQLAITINGSNYNQDFIKLLDSFKKYLETVNEGCYEPALTISYDKFHLAEMKRLGLEKVFWENCQKYQKSGHLLGYQSLDKKLFNEGNAINLNSKKTIPLRPMPYIMSYVGNDIKEDRENGLLNIGPIVTINTEGIVTEADGSYLNQRTIYNYGNILDSSLEDICLNRDPLIVPPKKYFKECVKAQKKYQTYLK